MFIPMCIWGIASPLFFNQSPPHLEDNLIISDQHVGF